MLAYPVVLCAAAVFAVTTSLEYRSAGEVPDAQGMGPRQLAVLVHVLKGGRVGLAGR